MYYFDPETAEKLDIRVYDSPVDRSGACRAQNHRAIIITARGRCLPKPVLLARCPGHRDVFTIWNPGSHHTQRIIKYWVKKPTAAELRERIYLLGKAAHRNAIAAQARNESLTSKSANLIAPGSVSRYYLRTSDAHLATAEEQAIPKWKVDTELQKHNTESATTIAKDLPVSDDVIDLTSNDDWAGTQIKQEPIDANWLKEATVIFFKNAEGVIERKAPLAEIANARSLYLHFTTAFRLNATEDVLMLASVNGGRAIRLVSNCKGDFETLWLAIKNDSCWSNARVAKVNCKVDIRLG